MEKVIRDGKVAVLYSPGFGAGWKSWGAPIEAVFHPALIEWVEKGKLEPIEDVMSRAFPNADFYLGGASDLEIEWIPQGTSFRITKYDGSEDIEILGEMEFIVA
jgi:hypothetical protein